MKRPEWTRNRARVMEVAVGVVALIAAAALALVLLQGHSGGRRESSAPPPTPSAAVSSAPDSGYQIPDYSDEDNDATQLCEGSVQGELHLSPDILTYTDVSNVRTERLHGADYFVTGYVNDIEFECSNIHFTETQYWDQHAFDVTIGGIDYMSSGDF